MKYNDLMSYELIDELIISSEANNLQKGKRIVKHIFKRYHAELCELILDQIENEAFFNKMVSYYLQLVFEDIKNFIDTNQSESQVNQEPAEEHS